jgi:hypothetical protein
MNPITIFSLEANIQIKLVQPQYSINATMIKIGVKAFQIISKNNIRISQLYFITTGMVNSKPT